MIFLVLSGIATGLSWLCYYRALQLGTASRVASIDKLSVVLVVIFAAAFLGERLTWKNGAGAICVAAGALLMAPLGPGPGGARCRDHSGRRATVCADLCPKVLRAPGVQALGERARLALQRDAARQDPPDPHLHDAGIAGQSLGARYLFHAPLQHREIVILAEALGKPVGLSSHGGESGARNPRQQVDLVEKVLSLLAQLVQPLIGGAPSPCDARCPLRRPRHAGAGAIRSRPPDANRAMRRLTSLTRLPCRTGLSRSRHSRQSCWRARVTQTPKAFSLRNPPASAGPRTHSERPLYPGLPRAARGVAERQILPPKAAFPMPARNSPESPARASGPCARRARPGPARRVPAARRRHDRAGQTAAREPCDGRTAWRHS